MGVRLGISLYIEGVQEGAMKTGPRREELTAEWKLYSYKLCYVWSSLNINSVICLNRMGLSGHEFGRKYACILLWCLYVNFLVLPDACC